MTGRSEAVKSRCMQSKMYKNEIVWKSRGMEIKRYGNQDV